MGAPGEGTRHPGQVWGALLRPHSPTMARSSQGSRRRAPVRGFRVILVTTGAQPSTENQRRRAYGFKGVFLILCGALLAVLMGHRLYQAGIGNFWVGNDPVWLGVLAGGFFFLCGGLFIRDWLFARDLPLGKSGCAT